MGARLVSFGQSVQIVAIDRLLSAHGLLNLVGVYIWGDRIVTRDLARPAGTQGCIFEVFGLFLGVREANTDIPFS